MSFNEKLSYTEFVVETPTTDFNIGFSFTEGIDKLGLLIDDVDATEAGYTYRLKNSMTVEVTPPVASGIVRISRETNLDSTRHVFKAAAKFVAANMDTNFTQLLHSQQEVRDQTNAFYKRIDLQIGEFTDLVVNVQDEFQAVRDTADDARDVAERANSTSNDALQVANGIAATAQDAFDTAARAEDVANAIDGKAQQALDTANDAEVQAADAVIKSANATTIAEGIAGTANEASTVANEARVLAVEAKDIANDALAQTTLQPATITTLGGIKVGAGLAITSEGVLSNTGGMPLGVPLWHNGTRLTIDDGYASYDGQLLKRVDFPSLWAKVQSKFVVISDAEWLANPTKRAAYSSGDGSKTFRMPDLNGFLADSIKGLFLRGDGNGSIAGEIVSQSTILTDAIRNITGSFEAQGLAIGGDTNTGAFKLKSIGTVDGGTSNSSQYERGRAFDASLVVPTAEENRPVSAIGIWICRVSIGTAEQVLPNTAPSLTGGNTWAGSQDVQGDLIVSGRLEANIKPLLNATGEAPISACRAWLVVDTSVTPYTIIESFNISSVAASGTGIVILNYIKPMPKDEYVVLGSGQFSTSGAVNVPIVGLARLSDPTSKTRAVVSAVTDAGVAYACRRLYIGVFC